MGNELKGLPDDELVSKIHSKSVGGYEIPAIAGYQAELTRRLNQSVKELNKSTSCYSKVLIVLTIAMLIVVVAQILIQKGLI